MYKIKQNSIYKLEYEIKLNSGLIFKTNNEKKLLEDKIKEYSLVTPDDENYEKVKDKLLVYKKNLQNKLVDIQKYIKLKKEAEIELENTNNGINDDKLNEKYLLKEKQKEDNKQRRDDKKNLIDKTNKDASKKFYSNSYKSRKQERYQEKNINYHYNLFMKKSNSVPKYILTNLDKMPNNRGYIWKGVWFWGRLPEKENDNTMCMYEICGKKTYIRQRNNEGQWTIRLKKKH